MHRLAFFDKNTVFSATKDSILSNKQAINLTSLSLIQDELMTTIDDASTHLETFISERDNLKVLEDCVTSLQQIRGSLDLIQLYGACELAGEILLTATQIDTTNPDKLDDKLSALTKGFFVLSCYFEYTQQHEVGMPVLLVPYINDIRLVNRAAVMPESYFEPSVSHYRCPQTFPESVLPEDAQLQAMVRRFRHMYQIGLLGVIKEIRVEQSLKLMARAVGKVYKLAQGTPTETLWWLASHALNAFIEGNIRLTVTRKRLFSQLDKRLKQIEKQGASAFEQKISDELIKEFAYYIAIADIDKVEFQKIKQLYGFENIGYNESILQQETMSLTGPNANTVQSVAEVLRLELNIVKASIENAQSADYVAEHGYQDTISRVQKVKDILSVVGLTSAADVITQPLVSLVTIEENKQVLKEEESIEIVNALLYVESVINSLVKRNFSGEKLAELNKLTQNEMISSHHLHDAQLVVISEAEQGLVVIKQLLTAFADSDYDNAHLTTLSPRLDEVRGAMTVLNLPRAAAIIYSCSDFLEKTLMASEANAALEHMMETFADALICLEYYLDCMKVDKNVSPDTLTVAEESLAALGYCVRT
ncbi:MAG: hypothetical protein ACI9D5_002097 [Candidatus Endobugula sp.]